MACRRGRCVRWQARSPYPTDERTKASRCAGGSRLRGSRFAEIDVEVLLDWNSHSEVGNPCRLSFQGERGGAPVHALSPPNWLIAESSKAYAFTVQRPGDAGLSAEDVQVQVEIKGKGEAGAGSDSWAGRTSSEDGDGESAARDSIFASSSVRVQRSVSSLLTIFCERLGISSSCSGRGSSSSSRDPPCHPGPGSGCWEQGPGQFDDTSVHHSCTGAPLFGPAMASPQPASRDGNACDCTACRRAASGLPWKFGRRFSLPLDADAERAFAAHANGTLTVLIPRSRTVASWMPPSASSRNGPAAQPHDRDGFPGYNDTGPEKRWMLRVVSVPRAPTQWPSCPEDVVWRDAMGGCMSSGSMHAFPSPAGPFPAWESTGSVIRGTSSNGNGTGHDHPSLGDDDAMDVCF